MSDATELPTATGTRAPPGTDDRPSAALAVLWCGDAPNLEGAVLQIPDGGSAVLGRGPLRSDDPAPRVFPVRMRPGRTEPAGLLELPRLSRVQLELRGTDGGVVVRNVGRTSLIHRGVAADSLTALPGDVLVVAGCLVLLVVVRPTVLPAPPLGAEMSEHPFGEPDVHGIVGEAPCVWELREHLAFVGGRRAHVLLQGASGSGKELVARALAGGGPWVSRNAATLPAGLLDAELFGNKRNYPNPGMAERLGLIGEADGGTLFLDEIGELPHEAQAHLLRVLDSGEYQRLGDDGRRTSRFRLVAATNRDVAELKHDLAARLRHRLRVPGLDERLEDLPLLIRSLFRRLAADDVLVRDRFLDRSGVPRVSADLVAALAEHRFTTHVRELETLLWDSMMRSRGDTVAHLPEALVRPAPEAVPVDPTIDRLERVLVGVDWNVAQAARELGLSRFQLIRLMKKNNLERP